MGISTFLEIPEDELALITGGASGDIGCEIRKLRRKQDISQVQLSLKLNVSTSTVSHWEQGIRVPEIDTLIEIAELFDVSLDVLVSR